MSTNLVAELRRGADTHTTGYGRWMREAADEIERLTAEVCSMSASLDGLLAERDRLRAALERITTHMRRSELREIAREALAGAAK